MSLCIFGLAQALSLSTTLFTLTWTHSIEKAPWQEIWRVSDRGLELMEARIKGSGAGMEPPPTARLENGWWVFTPEIAPRKDLVLAESDVAPPGWLLCPAHAACIVLKPAGAATITLRAC